jgi:predicted methyltransferase
MTHNKTITNILGHENIWVHKNASVSVNVIAGMNYNLAKSFKERLSDFLGHDFFTIILF